VRYLPYGGIRVQVGEMPTALGFTGQRLDAGVGLLYYRARYYDPVLGRFIQPDTVLPDPSDPQGLNRYGYVRNNPLRFTDPTGHCIPGVDCPEDIRQHKQYGERFENGEWLYTGVFPLEGYDYYKTTDAKRTRMIYEYALYLEEQGIGGCEALARITEYAAALYAPGLENSDKAIRQRALDGFMTSISDVIVGWSGPGVSAQGLISGYYTSSGYYNRGYTGGLSRSPYWIGTSIYPDDFATTFSDGTRNQPYHFWFYVASAYFDSPAVAAGGVALHDPPGINDRAQGISDQDFNLGMKGVELVCEIAFGKLDIPEVGNWIRLNLQKR